MHASDGGFATVIGADVAVIAVQWRPREAGTGEAVVLDGADVVVVTGGFVVGVYTAAVRGTGIVSAGIPIIAVERNGPDALTFLALLADGAGITVIAGFASVGGLE